jgi:hypothetical protein
MSSAGLPSFSPVAGGLRPVLVVPSAVVGDWSLLCSLVAESALTRSRSLSPSLAAVSGGVSIYETAAVDFGCFPPPPPSPPMLGSRRTPLLDSMHFHGQPNGILRRTALRVL